MVFILLSLLLTLGAFLKSLGWYIIYLLIFINSKKYIVEAIL